MKRLWIDDEIEKYNETVGSRMGHPDFSQGEELPLSIEDVMYPQLTEALPPMEAALVEQKYLENALFNIGQERAAFGFAEMVSDDDATRRDWEETHPELFKCYHNGNAAGVLKYMYPHKR